MKVYVVLMLLILSPFSNAVLVSDVGINYVGMYGDGRVFASLDKTISVSGCENATWVLLSSDHAHKKDLYSMLLTASAAGKKIDISSSSCVSGSATISEGTSDYILVK